MAKWLRRAIWGLGGIVLVSAVSLGLLVWLVPPPAPLTANMPEERRELNGIVFDAVWDRLDRSYYDHDFLDAQATNLQGTYRPAALGAASAIELYLNVLNPMLAEFDQSHLTADPPPGEIVRFGLNYSMPPMRRGSHPWPLPVTDEVGLGMAVAWDGQTAVVDAVLVGSPAEKNGIEPGSRIRIIQMRMTPRNRPDLKSRGSFLVESGSDAPRRVSMAWHEGEPLPERASRTLADGATVLRFDTFTRENVDWALAVLSSAGPEGVILDLRSNSGGSVRQQNRLLAALLSPGLPTGITLRGHRRRVIRTPDGSRPYTGPLAVLIGLRSASAAEATAAAIQFHRRGVVVGQRSAGALLTSRTFTLPDGGSFTVPVGDYLAPDGRRIEGVGVTPDIEVQETLAAVRAGADLTVDAASDALRPMTMSASHP
ncbi:MAG: hypothetical protein K2X25_13650 [Caulobacteraceae bacterium]|nr:hypothetical protein [Caulobacteraceae bacterium]